LVALLWACATRGADRQRKATGQQDTSVPNDSAPRSPRPVDERQTSRPASAIAYYPASIIRHVGDLLAQSRLSGRTIADSGSLRVVVSRRVTTGEPETHDAWTDVALVQGGHAMLFAGGQLTGSHLVSAGEHRGGTMNGSQQQPLAAGDLFVVPAGVPHQFRLAPGDTIRYLTLKVPRQ
jgi:hypothetical protein